MPEVTFYLEDPVSLSQVGRAIDLDDLVALLWFVIHNKEAGNAVINGVARFFMH
ncbi:hypothetical protein [Paenibacillus sp. FSL H3-0469]|uniref:hypothetical protein n=1 Tax=Paenibacillus sp. FSL H3-0469 TaxID=2954506 RepID=UPI0031015B74